MAINLGRPQIIYSMWFEILSAYTRLPILMCSFHYLCTLFLPTHFIQIEYDCVDFQPSLKCTRRWNSFIDLAISHNSTLQWLANERHLISIFVGFLQAIMHSNMAASMWSHHVQMIIKISDNSHCHEICKVESYRMYRCMKAFKILHLNTILLSHQPEYIMG